MGRSLVMSLLPSDNEVQQCTEDCKSVSCMLSPRLLFDHSINPYVCHRYMVKICCLEVSTSFNEEPCFVSKLKQAVRQSLCEAVCIPRRHSWSSSSCGWKKLKTVDGSVVFVFLACVDFCFVINVEHSFDELFLFKVYFGENASISKDICLQFFHPSPPLPPCPCFFLLQQPKELVSQLHDDLVKDKLATLDSAKAFVKMLRSFRNAGKSTIAEVLTSPDSYYLV